MVTVKVLSVKPEGLSRLPGTHMAEAQNQLLLVISYISLVCVLMIGGRGEDCRCLPVLDGAGT